MTALLPSGEKVGHAVARMRGQFASARPVSLSSTLPLIRHAPRDTFPPKGRRVFCANAFGCLSAVSPKGRRIFAGTPA